MVWSSVWCQGTSPSTAAVDTLNSQSNRHHGQFILRPEVKRESESTTCTLAFRQASLFSLSPLRGKANLRAVTWCEVCLSMTWWSCRTISLENIEHAFQAKAKKRKIPVCHKTPRMISAAMRRKPSERIKHALNSWNTHSKRAKQKYLQCND